MNIDKLLEDINNITKGQKNISELQLIELKKLDGLYVEYRGGVANYYNYVLFESDEDGEPTGSELGEVCEMKSSSSDTAYKAELVEIIDMILTWWKEHEFDSMPFGDDYQNVFDEVPSFVIEAKHAKKLL